ncbi:DUF4867 family protein [Anaerolentibacter hominis]|uniref:DUF4867 family protein n=1 Tax=Anaerolentibacter hominis TaxID=3079009 RepID=UPI0031B8013E
MKIQKVTDPSFRKYGRIIDDYDLDALQKAMEETPCPEDRTIYVASSPELEALEIAAIMQDAIYGGLPAQMGFCNGSNHKLNALEYHRSSEINYAATDLILQLGWQPDITDDYQYDTNKVEAFLIPKGTMIEVYATTLHYAPSCAGDTPFRCMVALPRDTNLPLDIKPTMGKEDVLLTGKNKWRICHPDAGIEGGYNGMTGPNHEV